MSAPPPDELHHRFHSAQPAPAPNAARRPGAPPWGDPETEERLLLADLERLGARRRAYVLMALDAAAAVATRLRAELDAPPEPLEVHSRDTLRELHAAAVARGRLDDAVRGAVGPLDFAALRRALAGPGAPPPVDRAQEPALLLGNHCAAALFAGGAAGPAVGPRALPLVFLVLEVDGAPAGRVLVELREDRAPLMSHNFAALASGAPGRGYRGCSVFRCWEGESVIAGDFELNDGRGGRSAFAESHFPPDESRLACVRGAVGMRRERRRGRALAGLVGSQFRIALRDLRGFSAVFAHVAEGLPLLDRLSGAGDGAGRPRASIVIADCGLLE